MDERQRVPVKSVMRVLRAEGHDDHGRERLIVVPAPGYDLPAAKGPFGNPTWWRAALVLVLLVVLVGVGAVSLAP
jgi:hypothetical protein